MSANLETIHSPGTHIVTADMAQTVLEEARTACAVSSDDFRHREQANIAAISPLYATRIREFFEQTMKNGRPDIGAPGMQGYLLAGAILRACVETDSITVDAVRSNALLTLHNRRLNPAQGEKLATTMSYFLPETRDVLMQIKNPVAQAACAGGLALNLMGFGRSTSREDVWNNREVLLQ